MKNRGIALLLSLFLLIPVWCLPADSLGTDALGTEATLPAGAYDGAGGGAYTELFEKMLTGAATIDISEYRLTKAEAHEVYSTVYYSEAELFFINGSYTPTCWKEDGIEYVREIEPGYEVTPEEIPARLAAFYGLTDQILALAGEDLTDVEKVAFVHDYIALHYTYDDTLTNYDAYSLLRDGTGVCQAYSLLARYLLRRLGIPCECVTSLEINHEWNTVSVGGKWYHMDITWDDDDDTGLMGQVKHLYFLRSDNAFRANKHPYDWVAPYACSDTAYDSIFAEVSTAFVFGDDGDTYFIRDGAICRYNSATETVTELKTITDHWHTYPWNSTAWDGVFSGLSYIGGTLIYNTESEICSYNIARGTSTTLKTFVLAGGYLYGSQLDGATLTYSLMTEPNESDNTTGEYQIGYTVTWSILGTRHEEYYLFGATPVCKLPTDAPEDDYRYTFTGWDKRLSSVRNDVTYTAQYSAEKIFDYPVATFLAAVETAKGGGETLYDRYTAIRAAVILRDAVNPTCEGYSAAATELIILISAYDAEVAEIGNVFAGLLPGD